MLVDARIVRGERAGIAPVPVEARRLLRRGRAERIEKQGRGVEDQVGDDGLGLRGLQFGDGIRLFLGLGIVDEMGVVGALDAGRRLKRDGACGIGGGADAKPLINIRF